ncbi:MAG: Wzy polymerase domain-containing protein [Burkholderiaceae bacterium]|nr:Wzy polymerase domain-containing protein [Burkholderiaceae bacterium]
MLAVSLRNPITALAVALPFVFPFTQAPNANFWPLMVAWCCAALVWSVWWWRAWRGGPGVSGDGALGWARAVAQGLLLGAVLGAGVGLVQYFQGDPGWQPWVSPSLPGQAMGNLRQRNQQASLLSLGVWALLWLLAQVQARIGAGALGVALDDVEVAPARGGAGLGLPLWLWGFFATLALVVLALGSAATTSRTGLVQWGLVVALLLCWRASTGRLVLGLAVAGLVIYLVTAWVLPQVLLHWTGFHAGGLFSRFGEDAPGCTSRRALWANVLHLIAQKPWLGWGWGELDYAHYVTLFPGERFCTLLDNAHNLPLHLAVELGLPLALLVCGGVLVWVWRAQPWHETDPARQLAWGILVVVGLHSLLEFPLWYGPFQLVTLLAVGLLLWRGQAGDSLWWHRIVLALKTPIALVVQAFVAILLIAFAAYAMWDYHRLAQVFLPPEQRSASTPPGGALAQASRTVLFSDQADFAQLTTTPLTLETAPKVHALAREMLHFSPEPKVIEALIESATLLGHDDEAAFHWMRYRAAFPAECAQWSKTNHAFRVPRP